MAVKTVTGKLTTPDGVNVAAALVQARLSAQAVVASTNEVAPGVVSTLTAADGSWSLSLQSNLDLTPNTTYYTISVGNLWTATVVVPSSAGPFKIEDVMAAPPAVSPPAALDSLVVHLANTETITGVKDFALGLTIAQFYPQLQRGNKTIGFGDSITLSASLPAQGYAGDCYLTYTNIVSNQRIQYAYNAGIAGNTTADMLARVQTDVIARAPARCLILGGINDQAGSVPFATTVANLTAIISALLKAQIEPVLCTLCPNDNTAYHAGIAKLNAWIKGYCTAHGLSCIDFYSVLVDPTNGKYKATLGNADGTHPLVPGQVVMANEAARLYPTTLPAFRPYLVAATDALDVTNLLLNGTMQSGGTRATSWSLNSGLANTVESIVTGDTSIVGNWQQIAFSGATAYELRQIVTTGFAVGDKLALSGVISAIGFSPGTYTIRALAFGGSPTGFCTPIGSLTGDITQGTFYMEGVVPSGTTDIRVSILGAPVAGGATLKVAQVTLINLTTLGL